MLLRKEVSAVRCLQCLIEYFSCRKTDEAFNAVGEGPIDLPTFLIKVVPAEIPVKNGFKGLWLTPEHRPGWGAELAVSCDVVEIEAYQEWIGLCVVAIFMAPAGIVFNPKAEGVVLNWINNACH